MIIAISGKINSGKDTVGKIIQILCNKDEDGWFVNNPKKALLEWNGNYDSLSNWKIKKFAGKLKQIVSILTGIPVEDLEKQEVKDKVLKKEWWYYKGETQLFPYDTLYESNKKLPLIKPTVREKMVEIADDIRSKNPNAFVNALFADYKKSVKQFGTFVDSQRKDPMMTKDYPNWIISDMRFPNELQAVKDRGGITIRVNRNTLSQEAKRGRFDYTINGLIPSRDNPDHPSETSLDNSEFDYTIDNNSDIQSLIDKVKEILIKEKII